MPSSNTSSTAPSAPAAAPTSKAGDEQFLSCPTGVVEYYFASPGLRWSDELYRIHGYERGEIVPTLELGISHFEPADQDPARALWEDLLAGGGPRSAYLSLRDAHGKARRVLISGNYIRTTNEHDSKPVGVWALVVDLTEAIHTDTYRVATEAVAASALKRGVIEQAKGILMGRTGCTASEAFEQISQHSQHTNRKVILIAQDIIDCTTRLRQDAEAQNHTRTLTKLLQHT